MHSRVAHSQLGVGPTVETALRGPTSRGCSDIGGVLYGEPLKAHSKANGIVLQGALLDRIACPRETQLENLYSSMKTACWVWPTGLPSKNVIITH